ncbi:MAG: ABC transporter permease [Cyanobacteria bacterium]|nr:ABC transporter permease [Cyanobacteriota bacterium]
MIHRLFVISCLEFVSVARLRWIRLFAVAFALLTLAAAWSAGSARELAGADSFARTTVALMPLVLLLVPLVAILVGVTGQTTEAGSDAFLYSQPVTRFEVTLGRWCGQSAALGAALAAGLGAGGTMVALSAGAADVARFVVFAVATFVLALVFLAIAALLGAWFERRIAALAASAFAWFFFVLFFDGIALASAVWLSGRAGARLLMLSVFLNPADLVRVLTLSFAGTPHLLGAAGESWQRFLGGPGWAALIACGALALWIAAPLTAARLAISRRDL